MKSSLILSAISSLALTACATKNYPLQRKTWLRFIPIGLERAQVIDNAIKSIEGKDTLRTDFISFHYFLDSYEKIPVDEKVWYAILYATISKASTGRTFRL